MASERDGSHRGFGGSSGNHKKTTSRIGEKPCGMSFLASQARMGYFTVMR